MQGLSKEFHFINWVLTTGKEHWKAAAITAVCMAVDIELKISQKELVRVLFE